MTAQTLECTNCRGELDVETTSVWQTCPYCGEDNAVPLTFREAGSISAELVEVQKQFQEMLAEAQTKAQRAAREGDEQTLRERVGTWVDLEFTVYDRAGVLEELIGVSSGEAWQRQRKRQIEARMEQLQFAVRESETRSEDEDTYRREAQQAAARRDAEAFVEAYERYLRVHYERLPQTDDYTDDQLEELIDQGIEQALRGYDWVSSEDLERLGSDTGSEAERTGSGLQIDCQRCGASIETEEFRESVSCPYCGAETQIQIGGNESTEQFMEGFGSGEAANISASMSGDGTASSRATKKGGHSEIGDELQGMIEQSEEMWRDSFADVKPESSRGRALTYYYLSNAFDYAVDDSQFRTLRAAYDLTEPEHCETCGQHHARPRDSEACPFME